MSDHLESTVQTISGSIERVTFHNIENGYSVIKVKVKGKNDLVTVIGRVSSVTEGEIIQASGRWSNHREFGLQLEASSIVISPPSSIEGIRKYLGSGMIKGIGPHFASKIVDHFGEEVFEVIENYPDRLRQIDGIGTGRLSKIRDAWKAQSIIRDIMVFLQSHGISPSRAVRIYKHYGDSSVRRVSENPFLLANDIQGIGFKTADKIASHLGISTHSPVRLSAGLFHILREKMGQGNMAYPLAATIELSSSLLEIDPELLKQTVQEELQKGTLIQETIDSEVCLFLNTLHRSESRIAEKFLALRKGRVPWTGLDIPRAIEWVTHHLGFQLADGQRKAIELCLSSKVTIITGGPGTGKTTLTRALVSILTAKKMRIALCSPTGRAAKRLSECTSVKAKTIHRLLEVSKRRRGFERDEKCPLETDLVLVDEVSMVDVPLMEALLRAIPPSSALILVGDKDQIPSVGPGCVLSSLIGSGVFPVARLTQIFRQSQGSRIVTNAHRINEGQLPELSTEGELSDFYFIEVEDPGKAKNIIVEMVTSRIPKKFGFRGIEDIQVLCPMNRGSLGTQSLNPLLQNCLNPSPPQFIERFGSRFSVGDKVMVILNDYDKDVFNGDIGVVCAINKEEGEAIVRVDGREIVFEFGELDLLSLAYATTIHKAQGSEYPAVIIPLFMQHYLMLRRDLLYTAVTRGKKLVIVVGEKKALGMAVRSNDRDKRWSGLTTRIKTEGLG